MAVTVTSVTDSMESLLSTTLREHQPDLKDNIFRELPLYNWLEMKGRKRTVSGGHQIAVPLLYGENTTTKLYSGYEELDVTPQEGITTAFYNWKQMAISITISREEELKNMGAARIINLLQAKTTQAEKSMAWYLNDLLHGAHSSHAITFAGGDTNTINSIGATVSAADQVTAGKGFNSLDHIVRSGWGLCNNDSTTAQSHIVGGVTCTSKLSGTVGADYADWSTDATTQMTVDSDNWVNPWWFNYSNPGFKRLQRGADGGVIDETVSLAELDYAGDIDGNTGQNIISAMRAMYNRLVTGADKPDISLCGEEVFGYYEAAIMPLERFTDMKLGDAGFQNLKFKTIPLVYDHGLSTSVPATPAEATPPAPLYFLNSDYLEWTVHPKADFYTTPFYRPENQDARTAQILLMANLCCSNRSKHGVISFSNTAGVHTPA